jgi:hypothetical protein
MVLGSTPSNGMVAGGWGNETDIAAFGTNILSGSAAVAGVVTAADPDRMLGVAATADPDKLPGEVVPVDPDEILGVPTTTD